MPAPGTDERVVPGSRLWVSTACIAAFGVVGLFFLVDLWTSVHEARVLHAGVVCGENRSADCLVQDNVVLGPYNDTIRTRMVSVYVRDVDAEPGDSDLVDLLPADYAAVLDFGERAVAHRVDGRVVALSRTGDSNRVVPAQAGLHAVVVDASFIVLLIGLLTRAFNGFLECRRAGVRWSGRIPVSAALRRRRIDALTLVGGFSAIVAFILATYDVRAWVAAAVLAVVVWWGPRAERRLRGTGRHAA